VGDIKGGNNLNKQTSIEYIDSFPSVPSRLSEFRWKELAKEYSDILFNTNSKGSNLPLCYVYPMEKETTGSYKGDIFHIPSYVGIPASKSFGEALTCLGGVLGALSAGIDIRNSEYDFVQMAKAYYSIINGHGLVLNNITIDDADNCGSFWYDIFPSILYFHIASFFPQDKDFRLHVQEMAETWGYIADKMDNEWEYTGYSLKKDIKIDNPRWIEPDAVVGIAYICYIAYTLTGDKNHLKHADMCMKQGQKLRYNPYYEILGSYGPYTAARMNAELGTEYDVAKTLQWVFSATSAARTGWGIINDKWGDYEVYGLSGSTTDTRGYAFSMNTYVTAALIAPVVRYAPRYAKAIGRYLINVAHNSKIFFPDGLPPQLQNNYDWVEDTGIKCISYEGVRNLGKTIPYGTGDYSKNFNPYGAWGVGLYGAMFEDTEYLDVLCVNITNIEFHAPASFLTYLLYNGSSNSRTIRLPLQNGHYDIYDTCSHTVVATDVEGSAEILIPSEEVMVLVLIPSGAVIKKENGRLFADGIPVDYAADGWEDEETVKNIHIDRAINAKATASSTFSDAYTASNVCSGDWHDRWVSKNNPDEEWLIIDLGQEMSCNLINIFWNAREKGYAARSYEIHVSINSEDWEYAYSTSHNEAFYNHINFNGIKCRYIKIIMLDKDNSTVPFGIENIQVFCN
jgi:hypothetical protein